MVKTYANNSKAFEHGKCLFFPKAKACATVSKPIMNGVLMRPYVAGGKKKRA